MPRSRGRTGRPWRRLVADVLAPRPLMCGLCNEEIDPDLPYVDPATGKPHPMYKTVHHIVPLSRGGAELDPANAMPAHLICNMRQGDRMPEQLWIYGEQP